MFGSDLEGRERGVRKGPIDRPLTLAAGVVGRDGVRIDILVAGGCCVGTFESRLSISSGI